MFLPHLLSKTSKNQQILHIAFFFLSFVANRIEKSFFFKYYLVFVLQRTGYLDLIKTTAALTVFFRKASMYQLRSQAQFIKKQVMLVQIFIQQARIKRFKEAIQTDQVQKFPLIAVLTSRYTSVIICVASSTLIRCLGVHQCKIS